MLENVTLNEEDDLIWGAKKIGAVIGKTEKATLHLLERKRIPANKIGRQWVAKRGRLKSIADGGAA